MYSYVTALLKHFKDFFALKCSALNNIAYILTNWYCYILRVH